MTKPRYSIYLLHPAQVGLRAWGVCCHLGYIVTTPVVAIRPNQIETLNSIYEILEKDPRQ